MTDKQIINTLRNIQNYCEKRGIGCIDCVFDKGSYCQIYDIVHQLRCAPYEWDIETIERIINETD